MDKLLSKLQATARAHPTSPVLRRILAEFRYLNGVRVDSTDVKVRFQQLQRDLGTLATQGLWEPSKKDEESLRQFKNRLGLSHDIVHDADSTGSGSRHSSRPSSTASQYAAEDLGKPLQGGKDISIVQPPPLSTPLLPVSTLASTVLPVELIQTLNHTFFLHLLATDPEHVLPPGKSLLSMMSAPQSRPEGDLPMLEDRVKDIVHRAFWKEALESLSNPSPTTQLPRLKRLYEDILATVKPLLPRDHPILVTLALPLSPTSAPLRSAIMHLREILVALRERCSPARDAYLDNLIRVVDEPHQLASTEELASLVVTTTRAILEFTDTMKEDLSQFVLGSMEEEDLKAVIVQQVMLREKALILRLWPPSRVEPTWKTWLGELEASIFPHSDLVQPAHRQWIFRLIQALGDGSPVNCPLPTVLVAGSDGDEGDKSYEDEKPPNPLPPPFFVTCPALLAAQNYLQALVIAASLRSLVRLAPRSSTAEVEDNSATFMQRIWTLLKASVDEEPGSDDMKIVNLADEVVRVRRACTDSAHPCSIEEEGRLRAAVDRTLQPHDPVFLLLHKRLLQALAAWLVSSPITTESDSTASTPIHMQTGHERPGKRPRLHLGLEDRKSVFVGWERERGKPPVVKGFEDEVLTKALADTFRKVGRVVDWTDRIWQDLVETGEIGGSAEKGGKEHAGTSAN